MLSLSSLDSVSRTRIGAVFRGLKTKRPPSRSQYQKHIHLPTQHQRKTTAPEDISQSHENDFAREIAMGWRDGSAPNQNNFDTSLEAKELHAKIVSGELEVKRHLTSLISSKEMTVETMGVCLRAEYSRLIQLRRPARARLMQEEKKELTRIILHYLLGPSPLEFVQLAATDPITRFLICYFAVAEGFQPVIEKVILMDLGSLIGSAHVYNLDLVRKVLISDLCRAHLTLAIVPEADDAIKCLFTLNDTFARAGRSPDGTNFSRMFGPTLVYLSQELLTGRYSNTADALWDGFAALYRGYHGPHVRKMGFEENIPISFMFNVAGQEVFHPSNPKFEKMLAFLKWRLVEVPLSDFGLFRKQTALRDKYLEGLLNRTAVLAEKGGNQKEGAWIKSLVPKLIGVGEEPDWENAYQV